MARRATTTWLVTTALAIACLRVRVVHAEQPDLGAPSSPVMAPSIGGLHPGQDTFAIARGILGNATEHYGGHLGNWSCWRGKDGAKLIILRNRELGMGDAMNSVVLLARSEKGWPGPPDLPVPLVGDCSNDAPVSRRMRAGPLALGMTIEEMQHHLGEPSEREGEVVTWEHTSKARGRFGFSAHLRGGRAVGLLAYSGWLE